MFVEGTRNPNPAKLIPFKKGAFRVAISRQLPLIPVVYSPYYFIDGKSMYFGKGKNYRDVIILQAKVTSSLCRLGDFNRMLAHVTGRIVMEVLDPIPTEGLTFDDMDDLISKVYKIMSNKNDELRAEFKKLKDAGLLTHCKNF